MGYMNFNIMKYFSNGQIRLHVVGLFKVYFAKDGRQGFNCMFGTGRRYLYPRKQFGPSRYKTIEYNVGERCKRPMGWKNSGLGRFWPFDHLRPTEGKLWYSGIWIAGTISRSTIEEIGQLCGRQAGSYDNVPLAIGLELSRSTIKKRRN